MDASVVICTYNRAASLRRTLESLSRMSVPEGLEWEVVVVDNGSGDGTRAVVEEFGKSGRLPVVYLLEEKQGKSHALNRGVARSRGRIVAFTDDDVVVGEEWLARIMGAFDRHEAACVGGRIRLRADRPFPDWLSRELKGQLAFLDLGDREISLSEPTLWGANLAVRAEAFERYGRFDTTMGPVAGKLYDSEDVEFVSRIIKAGAGAMYLPGIEVTHCIPESRLTKGYFRKRIFDHGEIKGLRMGRYPHRNILGIPLYRLRELMGKTASYVAAALVMPEKAFKIQLSIMDDLGFMAGRIKSAVRSSGRRP
jgi:glycosyltransferase involved in cell wall biosynthesis